MYVLYLKRHRRKLTATKENNMGRVISIANQKGGVGKTTTAINLSACLSEIGQKVLTIDIDPQGNTTSGLGVDKHAVENNVYALLLGENTIEECIIETEIENQSLISSDVNLAGAEIELIGIDEKEYILKKAISKIKDNYDFILCFGRPESVDSYH